MDLTQSVHSSAHKSSLVLLLKIVHHFMKGSLKDLTVSPAKPAGKTNVLALSQSSSQTLVDQMDFAGFLTVLIRIVWNIIASADSVAPHHSTSYGNPKADNNDLVDHAMYSSLLNGLL